MWYIGAMIRTGFILIAALMLACVLPAGNGQTAAHPAAATAKPASAPAAPGASPATGNRAPAVNATAASAGSAASAPPASANASKSDCQTGPCDYQPPKITVANAPAIVTPWLVRDQITWAANLVLVLLAYVGIMMAVSLLKKIERQTRATEATAEAARSTADAALIQVEALRRAERPWLAVAVEPVTGRENAFTVVAVNRGRSAARVITVRDQAILTVDEEHLPPTPQFADKPAEPRRAPVILLPGESLELKAFGRNDVKDMCATEELLRRVEDWQERIYLYGRILYADLTADEGAPPHETAWCCWYIHGRQKSGLVPAGPPAYRVHT